MSSLERAWENHRNDAKQFTRPRNQVNAKTRSTAHHSEMAVYEGPVPHAVTYNTTFTVLISKAGAPNVSDYLLGLKT